MKKNTVRILALVLVALMCLSLIPLAAHAEAHVHEMATDHQDPTCVDNGFDQTYCPICNTTFSMDYIPATGVHSFIPVEDEEYLIEEGDCTHPYQYWKSCSVCKQSAEEAYGLAVEQLVEELTARRQSGEQADWETVAKDRILLLDERYKFSAGGEGHHILHVDRQEATCTSDGWKEYTWCDVCGERFNFEAIPAKGHRWSEFKVTKEATCTEDGSRERVCEVCDQKEIQVIPALGHTWTAFKVTKAATCTEDGSQERTCTVCGEKEIQVIPAAHKFGEFVVIEEPTCFATGTKEHTCTVCGYKETESIPAAHKWGEFVVTQEPTCYSTGEKQRVCALCGETESEWIDMAHKYENGVCVYCGEAQPEGAAQSVSEPAQAEESAAYQTGEAAEEPAEEATEPAEEAAVPDNAIYISFDGNGAASGSMEAQAFEPGTSQNLSLNAFVRPGYRFVGWDYMADGSGWGDNLLPDGEEVYIDPEAPAEDMTLYAQWAEDPEADGGAVDSSETAAFEASGLTISFNANGGFGSMEPLDIPSSDEGGKYLTPNQFGHAEVEDTDGNRAAFAFTGWNTQADGSGKYFEDKQFVSANDFTSYDTDVTLYAQWVAVQVIFDANGGSGSMENQFINSTPQPLRTNTFTRGNRTYTYTGWDTDPNGNGQHFADGQIVSTADFSAPIVLYAQWKRNIIVTYQSNVDSGTGKKSYAEPMKYPGDSITIKTLDETGIPTKANRIFIEWNTMPDGSGDSYKPGDTMVFTENERETPSRIMLYAQWGFEVTFDPNGGVGNMEPIKAIENKELDLSEDAINQYLRDDYYFANWNTLKDGSGKSYADGATIPASDMTGPFTLYAQWKSSNITVSFNANGGEGTMEPQEGKVGVELGLNANTFTRDKYVFTGWNTAADGSGKAYADGALIPAEDVTDSFVLYAQWKKAVTITFNANGGIGTMDDQVGEFGVALTLNENVYTQTNYDFTGWKGSNGKEYADKATIPASEMTEDITLYAQWKKTTFVITFDANGGEGTMEPQEGKVGVELSLNANTFTREDYIFTGWNTKADGKGKAYADKAKIPAGEISDDITLYAQWESAFATVKFHPNGGSGEMKSETVKKGEKLPLPENKFTKEKAIFVCWNTKKDGTGTDYADGATITVDKDMTLYAKWDYAIVFYPNGGTGSMDPQSIKEEDLGKKVLLKANTFSRTNYSFDHWNTEPDDSGESFANQGEITPTTSVKLYAQWKKTSYYVNYDKNGGGGEPMTPNTISKNASGIVKENAYIAPSTSKIFGEWNTKADGTGESFLPGDEIESDEVPTDITLYAIWRDKLAIWFYPGEGIGETTIVDCPKGSEVKLPSYTSLDFEAPTGQTFAGWEIEGESRLYKYGEIYTFNTEKKVTAKWGDTITITYDPNGGVPASPRKLQKAAKNNDTKLASMEQIGYTRPDYEFKGWALSASAKEPKYLDAEMVDGGFTRDTTLYAVWKGKDITLTLSNNHSTPTITEIIIEKGTAFTLPKNTFTFPNKTFIGWNTVPNPTEDNPGISYADKDTIPASAVTENFTLYAQWAYAITFNGNGATSGSMDMQIVKRNEKTTLNKNEFVRTNYSFDSWNTAKDGKGESYADQGDIKTKKSLTLYAQWVKTEWSISYNKNGGGGEPMTPNTISKNAFGIVKENAYIAPSTSKIFGEWNTKADGTGESFQPGDEIESDEVPTDITLYAIWRDKLAIWFYPGEGDGKATTVDCPKGSEVKLPSYTSLGFEAPAGQTFAGWEIEGESRLYKSGEVYTFNTEKKVTAKWGDTITITYDPNGGVPASPRKLQKAAKNNDTKLASIEQIGYTRPGYDFKGWALTPSSKEARWEDTEWVYGGFSVDTTLYAVWDQQIFTGIVTISGSLSSVEDIGFVGETLTATVTGEKVFTDFSYQWMRDGIAIENATAETYVPSAEDFGCVITCDVTAKDAIEGKTKSSVNYKFIYIEEEDKNIVNNGQVEADYIYGVYPGMYYSINSGAKQPVSLTTGGAFPVTQQGIYRFFLDAATNSPVAVINVHNWWTIGYNISNGTGDSSGNGTVTMKRGSTTITSSTTLKDSSGNVILQPYTLSGYSNVWIVRQDAGITDITLTVKPSSGSYGHVSVNGGSYDSSSSERVFNLGTITQAMMYDIIFNKSSTSPRTADMSHLGLWSALCLTSFVGAATILGSARKRKKEQD